MLGVESAPTTGGPNPLMNSDLFDADDDESDEEVVRSMKPKQKRTTKTQRLILSDDEDEEEPPSLVDQGKSRSDVDLGKPEENGQDKDRQVTLEGIDDDDSGDDSSDDDKPKERKKIRRPVTSSDDSDGDNGTSNDDDDDDKPKERKKIRRPVRSSDEDNSTSNDDDDKPKERKKIQRPVTSSDDTSNDDDDKPKERKKIRRPVKSSDNSDEDNSSGDEDDDEEEIAFQLTPPSQDPEAETNGDTRSMRRKRISKDDLQQIHSETQRIVRESTIRIPYYRPTPLTLDELFNKKPSNTALKPIGGRVPRIHGKQLIKSPIEQAKTRTDKGKEETEELPDVLSSQIQESSRSDAVSCAENSESFSKDFQTEVTAGETETETVTMVKESGAIDETLDEDEVNDAQKDRRSSLVADEESPPSPTSPSSHSQQKEISPPKTSQDFSKEDQSLPKTSQQSLQEGQAPTFKTPPPTTSTRPDVQSSQTKRMKLLQDSLNRLKGAQPKLSGGPKITIDLEDDEEPSAEEKGVAKLMKRFVKHTRHVKKTHQKEVKVNIVTREKGEDGKEDLKHHTFTVGLDKKPEPIDETLTIPGAKLCRLKQNLQAGMRVKREQDRLKRQEVFQLDNEEGFQGEDDDDGDEAELTEGSETEEEEEKVIGDEDEDADYEPGNEFLDDEAESDDDDEMGYEMDDEEEESTVVKKLKKKSRSLEKESGLNDSDDEISPSRRKGSKKRAMVVDDVEDSTEEDKGISLRLDSTETDDTDTEISDVLQDSGRFNSGSLVHRPRTISALDQCSKTMEMFDSATNSTVTSDFQVPISRVDSTNKKVTWSASKDTDSSKDSMSFVLPAPVRQDSSSNSLDTSFETMTSLIPAHQPEGGMRKSGRASVDSTKGETFTPFSKHQSVFRNISSKSQTVSQNLLTLPVEDSQDLFRDDSPRLPTVTDSQQVTESQSFHFSFEDETQTQFLDENGLLNLKPSSSLSKKKTMFKDTQNLNAESQSSMEELLGLCSGQFSATQGQDEAKAEKPGPFSQVSQRAGTQANMDELLNLCSGTFTEMESKSQMTSTRKNEEEDEKEDDDAFFHIASDPDGPASDEDFNQGLSSDEDIAPKRRRRIVQQESDEDEDDEEEKEKGGEESDLDSEFEFEMNRERFKGKTYGKKMKLANFVEDEAELSGSEVDSDENYDAEDEPDDDDLEGIVNEEIGDEDELRNQVNKVHLKTMDDDDARRVRILKEMYLPDGDLHSDNKGRTRKFRWRHMESQIDLFRPGSDGEEEEEDAKDQDTQWRLQRYQREQWLKENEEKTATESPDVVTPPVEENSQFAKCLRAATIKKPQDTSTQDVEEKEKEKDKKIEMPKPLNIMSKRGSFLARNKNDLAKMASMLKPIANPQGPRSTRNFVFQSAEASLGEDRVVEQPSKVKRSASVSGPSNTPSGPQPKRPRLERSHSQFTSNSVFRHF